MFRPTLPAHPARRDDGLTLVETLVVLAVLGILAAIALPSVLSNRDRGQDAAAQTTIRSALSVVTACWTEVGVTVAKREDCAHGAGFARDIGVPIWTGSGDPPVGQIKIEVNEPNAGAFRVTAISDSGGTFVATRESTGRVERTCEASSNGGNCRKDGTW